MSNKNGQISVWNLSRRASVYPHLELDQKPYSQEEMRSLCNKLKSELPNLDIHIYPQSSYCSEINGPWNVCFSVSQKNNREEIIKYTYIIRRCVDFKKTFGCPFMNTDYIYDLKTTGLLKSTNSDLFNIIEKKLIELCPNSKKINYFDT